MLAKLATVVSLVPMLLWHPWSKCTYPTVSEHTHTLPPSRGHVRFVFLQYKFSRWKPRAVAGGKRWTQNVSHRPAESSWPRQPGVGHLMCEHQSWCCSFFHSPEAFVLRMHWMDVCSLVSHVLCWTHVDSYCVAISHTDWGVDVNQNASLVYSDSRPVFVSLIQELCNIRSMCSSKSLLIGPVLLTFLCDVFYLNDFLWYSNKALNGLCKHDLALSVLLFSS